MLTMIGKRLLFAIPSLIGVVIVTFLLTRALPGDPAAYFAGPAAPKAAVEQISKRALMMVLNLQRMTASFLACCNATVSIMDDRWLSLPPEFRSRPRTIGS